MEDHLVKSHRDLIAWRKAISLVVEIYDVTVRFPKHELYGLTSQLRRAAVSVASNVAEGHGRTTSGEFVQFLGQARGSLCEIETQIIIARELVYIDGQQESRLIARVDELGRILNGLIGSIKSRKLQRATLTPRP
jgi:four helix bundle protein